MGKLLAILAVSMMVGTILVYLVLNMRQETLYSKKYLHHYESTAFAPTGISAYSNVNFTFDERREMSEKIRKSLENKPRWKSLPHIIGIGVKKCGTGALISFLSQHPLIMIPK